MEKDNPIVTEEIEKDSVCQNETENESVNETENEIETEPVNESSDLVKTYVPSFDEFQMDPDKWLMDLPGYGDGQSGDDDINAEAQTQEFEDTAAQGDVSMSDDSSSGESGDAWGEAPTGGEFGGDDVSGQSDDIQTQEEDVFDEGEGVGDTVQTQDEDVFEEDDTVQDEDVFEEDDTVQDEI